MMGSKAAMSIYSFGASSAEESPQRKGVNIIFAGFERDEIDPLLSLIRTGRMSPRGRTVESRDELLQVLSERSWDVLLCSTHSNSDITPHMAASLLQDLNKDIPVIQLSTDTSDKARLQAYKDGIQALLPEHPGELLLHVILQQLSALDDRRRLRQSEAMLEVAERHYHEQVLSSRTGIGYLHDSQLCFANDSLIELLGYEREQQLIGVELDQLLMPDQRAEVRQHLQALLDQHQPIDITFTLQIVRSDNSSFPAQVQFQTCRYKGQLCLSINIRPEHDLPDDPAHRDADPQTGLKNGTYLMQRLDETAQRALSGGHDAQLIYIRLDRFESIRAAYGQEAVQSLITLIAERLSRAFNEPHLVCRFEEDSFAILFRHPDGEETLKLARKLVRQIAALKSPHDQTTLSSTCSIGIVTINDSAPPASELLHRARKAADELSEGNGCALYRNPASLHPHQDEEAQKRILNAITECRLKMLFQPIVPLGDDEDTHDYEVLIRLLDNNDAALAPNIFMTSVEQSDVMVKMDRWVIERALQLLHDEVERGRRNRLFVNIAGRSLRSRSLAGWFAAQLTELKVPPELVVFQLSESDAAAELQAAKKFAGTVRELGCKLCLKHFGSSPNSQRVFEELPVDFLKLDGAFIQDLESGDLTIAQLEQQLRPALERGYVIIAPLVENTRVISKLFRCGVQLIQGYYLQPPREKMDYDYFDDSH